MEVTLTWNNLKSRQSLHYETFCSVMNTFSNYITYGILITLIWLRVGVIRMLLVHQRQCSTVG